jgi:hypothetical protein
MPKPYSYDLRQKVLQAIKLDGLKKSEASCASQQRSANALQRFRYRPFRSEEIYQF